MEHGSAPVTSTPRETIGRFLGSGLHPDPVDTQWPEGSTYLPLGSFVGRLSRSDSAGEPDEVGDSKP